MLPHMRSPVAAFSACLLAFSSALAWVFSACILAFAAFSSACILAFAVFSSASAWAVSACIWAFASSLAFASSSVDRVASSSAGSVSITTYQSAEPLQPPTARSKRPSQTGCWILQCLRQLAPLTNGRQQPECIHTNRLPGAPSRYMVDADFGCTERAGDEKRPSVSTSCHACMAALLVSHELLESHALATTSCSSHTHSR